MRDKDMKTYTVMIIGDKGTYETASEGLNGTLAGAVKRAYMAAGVWAQIKEAYHA